MRTNYNIRNFRIFGEEGANIKFAPLTILTGCNSSGKSSIVKSVLLLDTFMKGVKEDYNPEKALNLQHYHLDFAQYPSNLLGRYQDVLNYNVDSDEISFSFTTYSNALGSDVDVEFIFVPDKNDILDNGHLKRLIIRKDGEIFYYSDINEAYWVNFELVKKDYVYFAYIHSLITERLKLGHSHSEGRISDEEYESLDRELSQAIDLVDTDFYNDVIRYMKIVKSADNQEELDSDHFFSTYLKDAKYILYIPLVDELSSLSKDEALERLETIINKEENSERRILLHGIVDKFRDSERENFGDFYHEIESQWLRHIILGNVDRRDMLPGYKNLILPFYVTLQIDKMVYMSYSKIWSEGTMFPDDDDDWEGEDDQIQDENQSWREAEEDTDNEDDVEENVDFHGEDAIDENEKLDLVNELNLDLQFLKSIDSGNSFDLDYSIIMALNHLNGAEENTDHYKFLGIEDNYDLGFEHKILKYMGAYVQGTLKEIFSTWWPGKIGYVSSTRVDIRRIYDVQTNNDFTRLLKQYFERHRVFMNYLDFSQSNSDSGYTPNSFINKWINLFGIGKEIKLEMDSDGAGIKIRLLKNNGKESLLANEGYGITQLMSILLQIESEIQNHDRLWHMELHDQSYTNNFKDDEYPEDGRTIAIEEPEIHLHPSYQSLLADMFVEAYKKYNIHFIIETHSEYLIRRLQLLTAKEGIYSDDISVYYVDDSGNPYNLELQPDGKFIRDFGEGFVDEADNTAIELFKINNNRKS